jgi:DNA-binding MarR family transcriptional regulator
MPDTTDFADWGPLFRPLARRSDPATSKAAARRVVESGTQAAQARAVLAAVRETPGLTSKQLAERHGLDRHMVARRTADLRRDGLVRCEDPAAGGRGIRWFPVEGE